MSVISMDDNLPIERECSGSRDQFYILGTAVISLEWLKLESSIFVQNVSLEITNYP